MTGTNMKNNLEKEENGKGFIERINDCELKAHVDGQAITVTLCEHVEHCYQNTDCVDYSEMMYKNEKEKFAVYYNGKASVFYFVDYHETIADQHA